MVQPYITKEAGDGKLFSFWFDFWHPVGPLFKKFSGNLLHSLGLSKKSYIAEFILDGECKWPKGRRFNIEVRILKQHFSNFSVPAHEVDDRTIWTGSKSGVISAQSTMKLLEL
ncbi:hypothetical protein ACH5RR_036773 [Cinchona calisaya]|uniref:Uncharacterized protein n=1 Tax=Cinchona calisaya TaxID=153742 RepID=A0ABD2Y8N6_9GENT